MGYFVIRSKQNGRPKFGKMIRVLLVVFQISPGGVVRTEGAVVRKKRRVERKEVGVGVSLPNFRENSVKMTMMLMLEQVGVAVDHFDLHNARLPSSFHQDRGSLLR